MSNLAVAGWKYLVNALDGFWCVQLRSKEAGGAWTPPQFKRPGGATYPYFADLHATTQQQKGLLPLLESPSASSGDHSDCIGEQRDFVK